MTLLVINEEQQLLLESARSFFQQHAPIVALRKLRDAGGGFDRMLWQRMVEMGWPGILTAESQGGLDFGHVGASIICEEAGRTLAASPFVSTALMSAVALRHGGSAAAADLWLPQIIDGTATMTFACDEQARHRPYDIASSAEQRGHGYVLNGTKRFVSDGATSDAYIVTASLVGQSATGSLALFVVARKAPGLSIDTVAAIDSHGSTSLTLKNVVVEKIHKLEPARGNQWLMDRVLDTGRLALAAEQSGMAQECFARTLDYIKQRKQFGQPIGSFQAIQHRAARLYCEIEVLRSAVLAAAQAMDRNLDSSSTFVSIAKAKADEVATVAANEAVQLHGGIGMTDEIDIGLFMKRIRVTSALLGDASFHADRYALANGF